MSQITYPTWDDVGIPKRIVEGVKALAAGDVLDYLVLNRVFRFQIKAQCTYTCARCRSTKKIYRTNEDYSTCETCGSSLIFSSCSWRMGKDKIEPFSSSDEYVAKIVQHMPLLFAKYFNQDPPENFLKSEWLIPKADLPIRKSDRAFGFHQSEDDEEPISSYAASCVTQFVGGEKIVGGTQLESVCKAAILCPYLWDDSFDWKYNATKGRGRETHLTPLFHLWARLLTEKKKSTSINGSGSPSKKEPKTSSTVLPPVSYWHDLSSVASGGNPEFPEAVIKALQNEPNNVLQEIFGKR